MIYEKVFRTFNDEDIQYIVAGGLAVNLHGAPRGTQDLDLFLEMSGDNVKKAVQALLDLEYEARLPVDPMGFADPEIRREWIESKNMNAFTFHHGSHALRSVDLQFNLPLGYEDCVDSGVTMTAGDLEIPVASIDDLITLKQEADREVDQLDVSMLEKLRELDDE